MQLTLNDHEADLLHGLLRDHFPALQREVARTEQKELRHLLVERLDLVERLLDVLAAPAAPRTAG